MGNRILSCILVLSLFFSLLHAQMINFVDETPEIIKDPDSVRKAWKNVESVLKTLVNEGVKMLMPLMTDSIQDLNISSTCIRDSMHVFAGMRKLQTWAFRFVDSTAKSIDGFVTGSAFSYGAYHECVDTVAINQRSRKNKGEVMFTGKYCVMRIKSFLPPKKDSYRLDEVLDVLQGVFKKDTILNEAAKYAPLFYHFSARIGVCIPSGCSVDDINQVLSKVADYANLYVKIRRCEVKENTKFTPLMIFVMCMYSIPGFMVLLGTLAEIYCNCKGKKSNSGSFRLLLVFSLISNFRKLMDTSTSSKTLSCLNGIRFLTMAWIILGHSYMLLFHQILSGLLYAREMVQGFAIQAVTNATVSVDTFFFLGGFLVCYVATNHVKIAKQEFNVKVYIIHRIFRILPAYIYTILIVFMLETMSSGPNAYNTIQPFVQACKKNWWANLLFINNFYNANDACVAHSWYLSLDMQFYIGALVILLPLFKWPKVGFGIAAAFIIGSMASSGIITYIEGYPPAGILADLNVEKLAQYIFGLYVKPYPHASSYVIGIIAGYLLAMNPKLKIPKIFLVLGWSTAIIFSISSLYGTYGWNQGRQPTFWETVLYSSCHRSAWSLSVAWMVICCATGSGGIVNYILSWKMWIPLGRLTFVAYLSHVLVQVVFVAAVSDTVHPKHSFGVWAFFGHLMATYGIAFVGTMLIESPIIALEKMFLPSRGEAIQRTSEKDMDKTLDIVDAVKQKDQSYFSHEVSDSHVGTDNLGFVSKL